MFDFFKEGYRSWNQWPVRVLRRTLRCRFEQNEVQWPCDKNCKRGDWPPEKSKFASVRGFCTLSWLLRFEEAVIYASTTCKAGPRSLELSIDHVGRTVMKNGTMLSQYVRKHPTGVREHIHAEMWERVAVVCCPAGDIMRYRKWLPALHIVFFLEVHAASYLHSPFSIYDAHL